MCSTFSFRPANQLQPKDPEDLMEKPSLMRVRVSIRFREKGYDEFMDYMR
jgi:hypothetical protein